MEKKADPFSAYNDSETKTNNPPISTPVKIRQNKSFDLKRDTSRIPSTRSQSAHSEKLQRLLTDSKEYKHSPSSSTTPAFIEAIYSDSSIASEEQYSALESLFNKFYNFYTPKKVISKNIH